ncbi:hypothetical protein BDZ89DRAFT_1114065 [Hymenopellis radicata]|nr:hypothetical protein BDZ89DRAFT_1114065 [Hymenopellis radicata]
MSTLTWDEDNLKSSVPVRLVQVHMMNSGSKGPCGQLGLAAGLASLRLTAHCQAFGKGTFLERCCYTRTLGHAGDDMSFRIGEIEFVLDLSNPVQTPISSPALRTYRDYEMDADFFISYIGLDVSATPSNVVKLFISHNYTYIKYMLANGVCDYGYLPTFVQLSMSGGGSLPNILGELIGRTGVKWDKWPAFTSP